MTVEEALSAIASGKMHCGEDESDDDWLNRLAEIERAITDRTVRAIADMRRESKLSEKGMQEGGQGKYNPYISMCRVIVRQANKVLDDIGA